MFEEKKAHKQMLVKIKAMKRFHWSWTCIQWLHHQAFRNI